MKPGSEHVKTVVVMGIKVDIYGCWDEETPEGEYDFYDLYIDGQCINEGNPFYQFPTKKTVAVFVNGATA